MPQTVPDLHSGNFRGPREEEVLHLQASLTTLTPPEMRLSSLSACWMIAIAVAGGCASSKEGEDRTPRRVRALDQPAGDVRAQLATASPSIRTVQLYRGDDERNLPVVTLRSRDNLVLEFDLLEESGRPLSVYFYHADREWYRDLNPSEYLKTFQRGDILNYQPSRATEVSYVHYRYRFPAEDIVFTLSGNYVLRVTEQGRENDILFERAFFVTEQATAVAVDFETFPAPGQGFRSVSPVAQFSPPSGLEGAVFDYAVCFTQNGLLLQPRCTTDPSLMQQPDLQFYLQPSAAFEPTSADYYVDLSEIRVGDRIERTNRSESPYGVYLEPDYARFGGAGIAPLLNGQSVVSASVRSVSEPATGAEYLNVQFSFVPPNERRLRGDIYVVGSFNNWKASPDSRLDFVSGSGRYEGNVLVKQGQHEYRYYATDSEVRETIDRGIPRPENLYTVFVYYSDIRVNTDRLLTVGGVVRP
jgi:hypothetical protein